jgi:hypothetical protein
MTAAANDGEVTGGKSSILSRSEMTSVSTKKPGFIRRLGSSLSSIWIGRVPDEVSYCEYECRKTECHSGDWERCELRLEYVKQLQEERSQTRQES